MSRLLLSACRAAQAATPCNTLPGRGRTTRSPCKRATETAVLGDFANARFEHLGAVTTFSRSGDKFTVNTDGPRRRSPRLRDRLHLRGLSAAAIPDRLSRAGAIRRSASPGTAARKIRAVSAGSSSTRASSSSPATHCTGPGATRPGTTSAPIATRPICRRTTTSPPTPMQPAGPISTWPARRATVRALGTSPGPRRRPQAAPTRRARTLHGWA